MRFLYCLLALTLHFACWGQSNTLTVQVPGFESDGQAYALLFKEGQRMDVKSKKCTRKRGTITYRRATFSFSGLGKGKYAVLVYHDQNTNGKLDTNFIGMPKEGVGNSNNHKGIPSFR
jgi:uncharacterized protein (DUF2141 family)